MSAQHTPGPWKAIPWQCHAATSVVVERDGTVIQVAECSGFGRMSDESIADARLIAAAPDLLLALGMLTDTIAFLMAGEVEQKLARAAIAKATGSAA